MDRDKDSRCLAFPRETRCHNRGTVKVPPSASKDEKGNRRLSYALCSDCQVSLQLSKYGCVGPEILLLHMTRSPVIEYGVLIVSWCWMVTVVSGTWEKRRVPRCRTPVAPYRPVRTFVTQNWSPQPDFRRQE